MQPFVFTEISENRKKKESGKEATGFGTVREATTRPQWMINFHNCD